MANIIQKTKQLFGYGLPDLSDITALITNNNSGPGGNIVAVAVAGAVPIGTGGTYIITAGVLTAVTVAAPVTGSQDNMRLTIASSTAFAHTITFPAGTLLTGSAANTRATFAPFAGSALLLVAYQGKWIVLAFTATTFS